MTNIDDSRPLNEIETYWPVVEAAHTASADDRIAAQAELARRYMRAIERYLLGAARDPHVADDLRQEFFRRLARGDFHRASPERGRFRDFIRIALSNMVTDHFRKRKPLPLLEGAIEHDAGEVPTALFDSTWRQELLDRVWAGLGTCQTSPFHRLLRLKAENPSVRSAELVEQMAAQTGVRYSEEAIRKMLQRARQRFADLLIEEVGRSIQSADPAEIREELADLGLLVWCKDRL
jgi:hypothetical protein